MNKFFFTNTKLGLFVLAGLFFLILLLYMIGKNKNLFGSNFRLKARFENVQGLKAGNNIRYAGIDIGTVKSIKIINDTVMEVDMIIENKLKNIIRKNALVSIGTDGLVGNKVVNILAVKSMAPFAENNDILPSKKPVDTDEMLRIFNKTNNDIAEIAKQLKITVNKVNNSEALWQILNDKSIAVNLNKTMTNITSASRNIKDVSYDIKTITDDINNGKGAIGKIISDSVFSNDLSESVRNIKSAGKEIEMISKHIDTIVTDLGNNINEGKGTINALLKDTGMAIKFNRSLDNIETGTKSFSDNMEALKHSFLFRGYFRKIEKQQKK